MLEASETMNDTVADAPGTGYSEVFVVDDQALVRASVCALLESKGMRVETFSSAVDCLKACEQHRPLCIVCDLKMPGMGGLELVKTLHDRGFFTSTVLISAHVDVPTTVRAMKAGMVNFLEKPLNDETLCECVRQCIEQEIENKHLEADQIALRAAMETLTPREKEVMQLVVDGMSNKNAARVLGVSPKTVEKHRAKVMLKLNAGNVQELVRMSYLVQG